MTLCARYRTSLVAALVLFSILTLAGYLYSPWHLHSRVSPNACPFSAFEHSAYAGESCQPVLAPPAVSSNPLHAAAEPSVPGAAEARRLTVRAPPA
jgi:hypothetical protein